MHATCLTFKIIKSDAEHKRVLQHRVQGLNNEKSGVHICRLVPVLQTNKTSKNSHDMKLNTSYP
ncbi:hypothetical protein T11_10088, partial [Trichinella zimbabwensis]